MLRAEVLLGDALGGRDPLPAAGARPADVETAGDRQGGRQRGEWVAACEVERQRDGDGGRAEAARREQEEAALAPEEAVHREQPAQEREEHRDGVEEDSRCSRAPEAAMITPETSKKTTTPPYGVWYRFATERGRGRIRIVPPPRASAFRSPGPAWNDELAAARSSNAVVSWNAPKRKPEPAAARAVSATCVELDGGMPMCSRAALTVRPLVSHTTIASMSQSVTRPKRRRPRSSSWPSWAIADDGASTPVASAIATGNDKSTASGAPWPRCADRSGAWP